MRRTSIELDDERLLKVQKLLGTTGIKDTVEGAFDEVIRGDLRRRLALRVRSGAGVDRGSKLFDASRPRR